MQIYGPFLEMITCVSMLCSIQWQDFLEVWRQFNMVVADALVPNWHQGICNCHIENNTNMSLYHWWQLSCDNFISTTGFIYWIKPKQHPCWPDVKWNTSYFPEIMRFIYLSCGIYISSAPGGGININIPDRNWYIKCTSNNNLNSVHYVPTAWHLPLPNNMTRARPSAEPMLIQCHAITITNADSVPSHHYNQCWFSAKPSL